MKRPLAVVLFLLAAGCAQPQGAETPLGSPDVEPPAPDATLSIVQQGAWSETLVLRTGREWQSVALDAGKGAFQLENPTPRLVFTLAWDATPTQAFEVSLGVEGGPVLGPVRGASPLTLEVDDAPEGTYHILPRPLQDPGAAVLVSYAWNLTATLA